jgi:hypothetical protein
VSEHLHCEFAAVDRPLCARAQDELRGLAAGARVTSTGLVHSGRWEDFAADPAALMEWYFDACVCQCGRVRQVMVRLPQRLLAAAVAQRYLTADAGSAWAAGENVIVSLSGDTAGPGPGPEAAWGRLLAIAGVRPELASGDLRVLYLGWLLCVQAGQVGSGEAEPPVPPGLAALSPAQRETAAFLGLDGALLAAAAEGSGAGPGPSAGLAGWVHGLPEAEKDALLLRAAQGEGTQVQAFLQGRYRAGHPAPWEGGPGRTAGDLRDGAVRRREAAQRLAASRKQAGLARRRHPDM